MNFQFINRGIVLALLAGIFISTVQPVLAADQNSALEINQLPMNKEIGKRFFTNSITELKIPEENKEKMNIKNSFSNIAFAKVEADNFLYIMKDTVEDSAWIGKIYQDNVLIVTETSEEWSKIQSGNIIGYIKKEFLITGQEAFVKAREILQAQNPDSDLLVLTEEEVASSFSYGETREEETARREAEKKAIEDRRQAVVDYAKKFLGNRYRWGGTSLTKGADCSGFVKSVYAHFGYSLPHSSYSQRKVGIKVSYKEIQPGDIVCYSGHVGIYAGNGQIVNALNSRKGIVMTSATHKKIVAVRRLIV